MIFSEHNLEILLLVWIKTDMERREFLGSVEETELSSSISNSSTTLSVLDGSTYPTGASNPFVLVLDRGTASEEKVLCSSRTGNSISVSQRGYDGTVASSHASGSSVDHVLDAVVVQSMNDNTFDNSVLIWVGVGG